MSSQKLLTSFMPLEVDNQLLKEVREQNDGKIVLKGIMQRADALNQNSRIYPFHVLQREMENYQKFINEHRALGQLDHPSQSIIELEHVSHIVTEAHWEGDAVIGTIKLLDTPKGKIAQSLIESGVKLGISSRGVGSTRKQGDVDIVEDDYMIVCFDLVSEPSTSGAFMLKEHKITGFDSHLSKTDRIDRIITEILHLKSK